VQQSEDGAVDAKFGRLDRYRFDQLTEEQCGVVESLRIALTGKMPRPIVDDSGRVTGGFNYLLIDPAIGTAFETLGSHITRDLPPRLREISILESARCLHSEYEWAVHVSLARQAGVSDDEIETIRCHREAASFSANEQLVREVIHALLAVRELDDETYERAIGQLGLPLFHKIVMQAGYYALMHVMLTAFDAPIPSAAAARVSAGVEWQPDTPGC
jgi:4-carboxymuconolactone decarboxylase